ncbi:hypothetical protein QAD02_010874 [Eretmocerus hayati]|uniref:Uncharacterized protein n=1 Tax=Eretmocerus hayati TaxID=131215 RepID=A0ACC2NW47_9HYME|nr:hypothetical protein QAD02_010874 [Eretmocerus hayati]
MAILPGYDIDEVSAADSGDHSLQMCTCLDIYLPGTSSSSSCCSVHSSSNSDASPPSDGSEPQKENLDTTCSECGKNFATKRALRVHTDEHIGIQFFICQKCGREFKTKHNRDKHVKLDACDSPHSCRIRSRTFDSLSLPELHVGSHTRKKPFPCRICGKEFSLKGNLNTHLRMHTGDKPFPCRICGKTFSQKSNLNTHLKVHTGEKPFSCSICNMNFSCKRNRDRHVKSHKKDIPFACRISASTGLGRFGTANERDGVSRLQESPQVNPGSSNQPEAHNDQTICEPLLVCPYCDKEFSSSRALFRHVEIRSCLKSFICDICDMIFKRKDNLKLHESIHRNGHSSPCQACGKCYNRGNDAQRICSCSTIRDDSSANVNTGSGNSGSINVLSRVLETDPDVASCNTETRTQLESIIEDICSSFYKEYGHSMNNKKDFES